MKPWAVVLLLFSFGGCGYYDWGQHAQRPAPDPMFRVFEARNPDYNFPAKPAAGLQFYDGFTPTRPYVIIGRLTIRIAEGANADSAWWMAKMKAADMGGDAVVVIDRPSETYTSGQRKAGVVIPHDSWLQWFEFERPGQTLTIYQTETYVVRWL